MLLLLLLSCIVCDNWLPLAVISGPLPAAQCIHQSDDLHSY